MHRNSPDYASLKKYFDERENFASAFSRYFAPNDIDAPSRPKKVNILVYCIYVNYMILLSKQLKEKCFLFLFNQMKKSLIFYHFAALKYNYITNSLE